MRSGIASSSTMFTTDANKPYSLEQLIKHMNNQYNEYQKNVGLELKPHWELKEVGESAEDAYRHFEIYSSDFFRDDLVNFLTKANLAPKKKSVDDKEIIIIDKVGAKNGNLTAQEAHHILAKLHNKITFLTKKKLDEITTGARINPHRFN